MRKFIPILILFSLAVSSKSEGRGMPVDSVGIEFLGMVSLIPSPGITEHYKGAIQEKKIIDFIDRMDSDILNSIAASLKKIKNEQSINDWLFYQLIRRTAEKCINKSDDYVGYTVYKWYLLRSCGYEPLISISTDKILLYVKSDDPIYNLPLKNFHQQQYVCLNYHDYGFNIALDQEKFTNLSEIIQTGSNFSFNIHNIPAIDKQAYKSKQINFTYKQKQEQINVLVNPEFSSYFKNYPVTDYQNQFNIPLSGETYQSLISSLKQKTNKFTVTEGVEYLMYFTRNAFEYERDTEVFGREKRLSPEETLLYEKSDCEDRSALFFYLVKEIYNLPMIVVMYEDHVTVAVKLNIESKNNIRYKDESYAICEPTPQTRDLKIGMLAKGLEKKPFEISYAYNPGK